MHLLGPYIVFICSTTNGYEGSGRSLSLKLIQELRQRQSFTASSKTLLKEIKMIDPIRYAAGDKVELWLYEFLFLNSNNYIPRISNKMPHPYNCELVYVNRDILFGFTKGSELLLQTIMSIYMTAQFENTPDDILMISDTPLNHIFVLIEPLHKCVQSNASILPDILAVAHLALEGAIAKDVSQVYYTRGAFSKKRTIPLILAQYFQDSIFKNLTMANVIRIAVHPEFNRTGYGTRTIELLKKYYTGHFSNSVKKILDDRNECAENIDIRKMSKDTFRFFVLNLADRPYEIVHCFGVYYELNLELLNFWLYNSFKPIYFQQTRNISSNDQKMILIKTMDSSTLALTKNWSDEFENKFRRRFVSLLVGRFRQFSPLLALSLLAPKLQFYCHLTKLKTQKIKPSLIREDFKKISPYDIKRLQLYTTGSLDLSQILDLVPSIAKAFFLGRLPLNLSFIQATVILYIGLQHREVSTIEEELKLPEKQVLALFKKAIKKVVQYLTEPTAEHFEEHGVKKMKEENRSICH
jgi:N-acetyltransferase 10